MAAQAADRTFAAGDQLRYVSVTQGYLVVWTRDPDGLWHANDEQATQRGPASDVDARAVMAEDDVTFIPAAPDA